MVDYADHAMLAGGGVFVYFIYRSCYMKYSNIKSGVVLTVDAIRKTPRAIVSGVKKKSRTTCKYVGRSLRVLPRRPLAIKRELIALCDKVDTEFSKKLSLHLRTISLSTFKAEMKGFHSYVFGNSDIHNALTKLVVHADWLDSNGFLLEEELVQIAHVYPNDERMVQAVLRELVLCKNAAHRYLVINKDLSISVVDKCPNFFNTHPKASVRKEISALAKKGIFFANKQVSDRSFKLASTLRQHIVSDFIPTEADAAFVSSTAHGLFDIYSNVAKHLPRDIVPLNPYRPAAADSEEVVGSGIGLKSAAEENTQVSKLSESVEKELLGKRKFFSRAKAVAIRGGNVAAFVADGLSDALGVTSPALPPVRTDKATLKGSPAGQRNSLPDLREDSLPSPAQVNEGIVKGTGSGQDNLAIPERSADFQEPSTSESIEGDEHLFRDSDSVSPLIPPDDVCSDTSSLPWQDSSPNIPSSDPDLYDGALFETPSRMFGSNEANYEKAILGEEIPLGPLAKAHARYKGPRLSVDEIETFSMASGGGYFLSWNPYTISLAAGAGIAAGVYYFYFRQESRNAIAQIENIHAAVATYDLFSTFIQVLSYHRFNGEMPAEAKVGVVNRIIQKLKGYSILCDDYNWLKISGNPDSSEVANCYDVIDEYCEEFCRQSHEFYALDLDGCGCEHNRRPFFVKTCTSPVFYPFKYLSEVRHLLSLSAKYQYVRDNPENFLCYTGVGFAPSAHFLANHHHGYQKSCKFTGSEYVNSIHHIEIDPVLLAVHRYTTTPEILKLDSDYVFKGVSELPNIKFESLETTTLGLFPVLNLCGTEKHSDVFGKIDEPVDARYSHFSDYLELVSSTYRKLADDNVDLLEPYFYSMTISYACDALKELPSD